MASETYVNVERLREGGSVTIYRALRGADRRPILLEVLHPEHDGSEGSRLLSNVLETGALLDGVAVLKPLGLSTFEGRPALELEDSSDRPLESSIAEPLPVGAFLDLALPLTMVIADLHERGVVHGDLHPGHILWNPETGAIRLYGLERARRVARGRGAIRHVGRLDGTLPYMSPEQTGRLNRSVDARSDLYALGVIFFRLLAGRLPFEADDASGWVYSHLAKRPAALCEVAPSLPAVLSSIVLRLLEKAPEERYQSAAGLAHDLRLARAAWRERGAIAAFPLGQRDLSDRFAIPHKLYGRDRERAALRDLLDRVATGGAVTLALVVGSPGIGKSSLIRALEGPCAARGGRFLLGKFEQYKREIPYAAVVDALGALALDILAEDADQIAAWRARIGAAVGVNAALLCELIPQLGRLLGPQQPVPELPPEQADNRIRHTFSRFIGAFPSAERPLTMALDDLQWIDAASLKLLVELVADAELEHLLIVGAYRDNEVDAEHPLRRALGELPSLGGTVHELALGPLSASAVDQLVADAVRSSRDDAAPLARTIRDKTGSNPFFVVQLLSSLVRDECICFDRARERFCWDLEAIRARPCADNVVDLIAGTLCSLPRSLQEMLELAACLGGAFDADTLSLVLERDPGPLLSAALDEALLLQSSHGYRFPHDRVQEAAYALIPERERPALHRKVGQKLLSSTPADALGERIFDIVNQLQRASTLITSRPEQEQLAELNLVAGRRAEAAGAYVSALRYFAAGALLLREETWERRYELAFALELGLASCELSSGELGAAEVHLAALGKRARGIVDQASVVFALANLALMEDRLDAAMETILSFLRRVGITWPASPTEAEVAEEYGRMRARLGDRPLECVLELPELTEPSVELTLNLLHRLHIASGLAGNRLSFLSVCRMVNLSLEHGLCDASALAFGYLGVCVGAYFGDYQAGGRLCQFAVSLLERRRQLRFRGVVLASAGMHYPWTQPLRAALGLLRRAFDAALDDGDPLHAVCALGLTLPNRLLSGDPLEELDRDFERALSLARKAKLGRVWTGWFLAAGRLVRTLRGLTPAFPSLDDASFQEAEHEAELERDRTLAFAAGLYWTRKLQIRYLGGDYAAALAAGDRIEALPAKVTMVLDGIDYHLYRALSLAAQFRDTPPDGEPQRRAALAEHVRALAGRAADCEANFGSQAALVAAELARIDGDQERAAEGYEQAIRSARDQGFVSMMAVSYETAACFYRSRGTSLIADTYLREARACYRRWGAEGKVRQLERQHPALARTPAASRLGIRCEQLDLLSVVKASQALSSVMDHKQVLDTLLELVLEHGCARLARLVLVRDAASEGELSVVAEAAVTEAAPSLQPLPRVPASIIAYVQRTESRVLLDDAAADAGRFVNDPYFARARPRSVLCLPVRRRGVMVGILYLENELAPAVFTPDRLLALELLATQAAVSLENAQLLARERAARQQAERDRQCAVLLGEATAIMSSSPTREGISQALRRVCAHGPADWEVLEVMEGGMVAHVVCLHREREKEPLLRRVAARYPGWLRTAAPAKGACSEGEPLHLPSLSDPQLRASCFDDQHHELACELGLRSLLVVPLIARGVHIGTLSFAAATPYRFQPTDVELSIELGRRVAMALDNVQLSELEQRLRQAQKMEALGRLAGGVAHDFNNLLCVILSYAHMLIERLPVKDPVRTELDQVRRAGERAADLTRQLLAFSRQQVLEPRAVDLDRVVRGLEKMLTRLLGGPIQLSLSTSPSLWRTWADPGQLEQVLVNLAVNARDAMPRGGTLTIRTCNVELDELYVRAHPGVSPGPHVQLVVTDTGAGMDRETQARIFEPFFTTKEPGRGTGLGLATVLGIVQQSGGHVSVASELGRGTTFRVYLPRSEAGESEPAASPASASTHGSETILLVEDDEFVRSTVSTILRRHGYTVLEASGPGEALLICEQHPDRIDVLLSEVVLPRMTGPELAERVAAMRPQIRLLFTSGSIHASRTCGDRQIALVQKPLTPAALTQKIREVLACKRT